MVRNRQEDYYVSLGKADQAGDLTPFVSFMLTAIGSALEQAIRQQAAAHPPGSEMGSEIATGTAVGPMRWRRAPLLSDAFPRAASVAALGQKGVSVNDPEEMHHLNSYRGGKTVLAMQAACPFLHWGQDAAARTGHRSGF